MDFGAYKNISFSRSGRILTITLDRPAALNAMDQAMHEETSRLFYDVAMDRESES